MQDSKTPHPPNRDVILPLQCPLCSGKVLVTYEAAKHTLGVQKIRNHYTCPHCRKQTEIEVPGLLVPPVQVRYD